MSVDWRNLPAVIAQSTTKQIDVKPSIIQENAEHQSLNSNINLNYNDNLHTVTHSITESDEYMQAHDGDLDEDNDSNDDSNDESNDNSNDDNSNDSNDSNDDEYEAKQNEFVLREKRKEKHLAKIKEVYGEYLSDGSGATTSTNSSTSSNDTHSTLNETDSNLLQTVRYRPPTRIRGCPHWRRGCKFEGDTQSLKQHIIDDCCFEKMKAMIKKRDHQITTLQNNCNNLQHQVHQLHSLLSSFISLQTPQLQSYLVSHLPTEILSGETPLNLNRNISSELYDAPHSSSINLSLHSLDDATRPLAYERREINRDSIRKHEISIGGSLGLIWRSMETIIGYDPQCKQLNPTVNFINNKNNNLNHNGHGLLTYIAPHINHNINQNDNCNKKDLAVRCLVLFWNKVISTSELGIQIWDILTDQAMAAMTAMFNKRNAKIQGLSHNAWLFNQPSFGVATQPFAHPYWLFTGHKRQIRIWKYNGFAFNTTCDCNACSVVFSSEGYGDVSCIAVSSEHIFASSQSNLIQFWKFSKLQQNVNIDSNNDSDELKRNLSGSSTHSVGNANVATSSLDKRINAIGSVEYLGNLVCGHRGMITSLKVFGDILISGSKDGFITIWSATQLINLSILHYGANPVLDFTIFPNPYPLCHITIWNEHLHALQLPLLCDMDGNEEEEEEEEDEPANSSYVSLNSLYDEIPKKEKTVIQDTILNFCGTDTTEDILNNEDAPDVLKSVFMAAMPGPSTASENGAGTKNKVKNKPKKKKQHLQQLGVLSREIMCNVSSHFGFKGISFFIRDLKLIVGGRSGEIHIWHIGNNCAEASNCNWEKESILRGHGDRVTCLESFGTHLMSAYSNGSIKLWKWDKSDFVCDGTAYTDATKRVGSADIIYDNVNNNNSYNSVRSVLLLPSPTLNLNGNIENSKQLKQTWSSCDDHEDHFSDDDMELNFNEFDVKISSTNGNDNNNNNIQKKKGKNKKHKNHKNYYLEKNFWILSGTSNGSMLLYNNSNGKNSHYL